MAETFESKALKDAQKALKQLEESAYDINTALIDITQSSDDLVNRIANLSGTSERLGAAWSVFSRLTVAIAPGIHKAEAALRSVAYIAKFQKVSREAEAKATKDILSTIKNIQKTRNKTLGVMEQIEKVQNGSATILEKEVIYRNDQLRYLIDMHGEATSQKKAFGYYVDGQVTAVLGTHTHVPTADSVILPKGTAYQTDVGMSGDYNSIIGFDINNPIHGFVKGYRAEGRFTPATENITVCGALIEIDTNTGLAKNITPIQET